MICYKFNQSLLFELYKTRFDMLKLLIDSVKACFLLIYQMLCKKSRIYLDHENFFVKSLFKMPVTDDY